MNFFSYLCYSCVSYKNDPELTIEYVSVPPLNHTIRYIVVTVETYIIHRNVGVKKVRCNPAPI